MVAEKRWGEARCQAEEVCAAAAGDQEKKRVQRSKQVLLAARASIAAAAPGLKGDRDFESRRKERSIRNKRATSKPKKDPPRGKSVLTKVTQQ
jgi:hypothetical protein